MNVLIIPAAKVVSKELNEKFFDIPSVLVPLETKTVIDFLYEQYKGCVDKIVIVAFEQANMIINYVKFRKYNDIIDVAILDKLNDLGYSVKSGIDYVKNVYKNIDKIYVNFGDTIINEDLKESNDVIFYSKMKEAIRWTTFEYSENKISNIYDKSIRDLQENYNVFIGVFSFKDSCTFSKLLNKTLEDKDTQCDSFYKALLEYNDLNHTEIIYTDKWMDVGHIDTYDKSSTEVKTRYFNTITIDKQRGILKKTSQNKDKFIKEIKWYLRLPLNIQYVAPRIFNYSLSYDDPYIEMEYYSYNNLHNTFVYGNQPLEQWKLIFHSLENVINEFKKFKVETSKNEVIETLNEMYIEKTIKRLDELRVDKEFKELFDNNIIINGKKYESINYYIKYMPKLLEEFNIYDIKEFQLLHGDFCLSNILYSLNSNTVRVIDPRGEFGKFDIYGDIRYDLAKLSHSIQGKYDFIIEDLFELEKKDTEINYMIYYNDGHKQIEELYMKELKKITNDVDIIELIESILFFSMIPLHKDYPNRQILMLATAVRLIDNVIKNCSVKMEAAYD
jgi:hypothetical protein